MKKGIQYAVITLIGIAFLYFVFRGIDWSDLFVKLQHTNYYWIAIGMAISILSHYIRAYRAVLLYDAMDYRISTANSFYAVIVGYMINYFIPRAGEVSRCAALNKTDDMPVEKTLGSVVTERIVDMVFMLLVLALAFALQFSLIMDYVSTNLQGSQDSGSSLKYILIAIVVCGALFLWLIRNKLKAHPLWQKIAGVLRGFGEGLASIRMVKKPFLFVLLSAGIWICYILMMYFCLFSMEATAHLSFADCLTVFAIGTIGVIIPAPGAGAGTYHYAVSQGLLIFGVQQIDGIAYATIVHGAQMILTILLGLICSTLILAKQKNKS